MPSSFKIINAPRFVSTDRAGLPAAIAAATPGTVITLTEAGEPYDPNLNAVSKGGYGVCVVLPLDQQVRITTSGGFSGLHFFGGRWSSDEITEVLNSTSNGVDLTGVSKSSWNGCHFIKNNNAFLLKASCSDIVLRRSLMEFSRADHMNIIGSVRVLLTENVMAQNGKGQKLCYFNDGRAPIENISQSSCTAQGGTWEDTAHNDGAQIRGGATDTTVTYNAVSSFEIQGLVNFGTGGGDCNRQLFAHNDLSNVGPWSIWASGLNTEVRDNTVLAAPGFGAPMRLGGTGPNRGGRNTAPNFQNPAGVDLGGSTITGDAVDPPELPQVILPPWAPEVEVPAAQPFDFAPYHLAGGGVRPSGTKTVGQWVTINRGQYAGTEGATWEYRWLRDGDPISGATAQHYQIQSADADSEITAQSRGTNANGTGPWHSYEPFTAE
jgi:hypothetical protein